MKSEIKNKVKLPHPIPEKSQPIAIPDKKNENSFIFITLGAYLVVGIIGVFHHEMWRDELATWCVGAASNSLGDLFNNLKVQYDPYLWNIIEFLLSRFTDSPLIDHIFHFLITAGSVYLILKYAPFSRLQRVLLCFSYYILYEYSIIARGYALTVFFTFLFCAFYQVKSKNRYLLLSLILFALPNGTGAHGMIIAFSLLSMMIADYWFTQDTFIRKKYSLMQLSMGGIIALTGIIIAYKCMSPPASTSYRSNTWFTGFDIERVLKTLRTFWMSFIPIPNFSIVSFWNTNILAPPDANSIVMAVLLLFSLALLIYCILLYCQKLSIAVFYLAATFGILLLTYSNVIVYGVYAARHYGFIFITFIAAAWLAPGVKKSKLSFQVLNNLRDKFKVETYFTYILTGLLALNTIGGAIAYCKDYFLIFSNNEPAGNYIKQHHLDKLPEIGFINFAVSPISAFTKQPIYFPERDTATRFTTWGTSKYTLDKKVLLARSMNFIKHQPDSVLYICNGYYFGIEGPRTVIENILFTRVDTFYGAVIQDENFMIYVAHKFDLNKLIQDSSSFHNPDKVFAILSSGHNLFEQGKLEDAEKIYSLVESKTHGMPVPHLHSYKGMLYAKRNMTSEAEAEYKTEIALKLEKEEAYFNIGMLYLQNGDADNAIKSWDSSLAINPKNAIAYNNIGVCFLNIRHDPEHAASFFEKAVKLDTSYTQGYVNLLICAQNSKNEPDFIKYARILMSQGMSVGEIRARGFNLTDDVLNKINSK